MTVTLRKSSPIAVCSLFESEGDAPANLGMAGARVPYGPLCVLLTARRVMKQDGRFTS